MWTSKDIIQYFIKLNASCKSIKKMQIHVSNKKIHLDIFSLQLVSNLMSGKTSVTGDFGVFYVQRSIWTSLETCQKQE